MFERRASNDLISCDIHTNFGDRLSVSLCFLPRPGLCRLIVEGVPGARFRGGPPSDIGFYLPLAISLVLKQTEQLVALDQGNAS